MNKGKLNLINLYDKYNMFLTDKQKKYFENYYFEDLSLQEIADNFGISKNAVRKQIKDAEVKLYNISNKVFDENKTDKLEKLLNKIEDEKLRKQIKDLIIY